ncbi:MAG TPA: NBR1-Ig-like domain-containing protein [Anaerolineales bacterium]|nr:NBR1-Ig-like domain-containing protein [Anaerolineales bacterium]
MIKKTILFALLTVILVACNAGATPAPTVDVNAINTAAFNTAMAQIGAQQTMTALAAPTITPLPTNTALSLATVGLPTTAAGVASPTGNAQGALPTVSFNVTPNTTPLAGFTPVAGSPVAPAGPTASLGDACNNNVFVADVTIPDGTVMKPGVDFEKVWRIQNTGSCKWDEGYKLAYVGGDGKLDAFTKELTTGDFVEAGETGDIGIDLTAPLAEGKYTETWRMQADNGAFFGTLLTVVIEVKK